MSFENELRTFFVRTIKKKKGVAEFAVCALIGAFTCQSIPSLRLKRGAGVTPDSGRVSKQKAEPEKSKSGRFDGRRLARGVRLGLRRGGLY